MLEFLRTTSDRGNECLGRFATGSIPDCGRLCNTDSHRSPFRPNFDFGFDGIPRVPYPNVNTPAPAILRVLDPKIAPLLPQLTVVDLQNMVLLGADVVAT